MIFELVFILLLDVLGANPFVLASASKNQNFVRPRWRGQPKAQCHDYQNYSGHLIPHDLESAYDTNNCKPNPTTDLGVL